jgi:Phage integrase, N-terminal SAM-like domain
MTKSTGRGNRRRSAGEGTVYPYRGGHRGAITWTGPDGIRHKRIVSGQTADEARAKLDALRHDLRLGALAPSGAKLTVAGFLDGWLEDHRPDIRESTWRTHESYVRVYLKPALGRRLLADLTRDDVRKAVGSFVRVGRPIQGNDKRPTRPVSTVTAGHVRATLRAALADEGVTHRRTTGLMDALWIGASAWSDGTAGS